MQFIYRLKQKSKRRLEIVDTGDTSDDSWSTPVKKHKKSTQKIQNAESSNSQSTTPAKKRGRPRKNTNKRTTNGVDDHTAE